MAEQHPKLVAALDQMESGDYGPVLAIALGARVKADDGRYCVCADPLLSGLDLMCSACLLNNRDQEKRKLLSLYGAHDFEADTASETRVAMGWCKCTYPKDDPRHHGVDIRCVTSWGEELLPPHDVLRAALAESQSGGAAGERGKEPDHG